MITLTSKLGRFEFPDGIKLSHAKLVRDTVVGQWFAPGHQTPRLSNENEIYEFMTNHDSIVLRTVPFEITLTVPKKDVKEASVQLIGDLVDSLISKKLVDMFVAKAMVLG